MFVFQVLGAWAPTYYNQVLGVALADVGKYTVWPMLCAIPGEDTVAANDCFSYDGHEHMGYKPTCPNTTGSTRTEICLACGCLRLPLFQQSLSSPPGNQR